MERLVLTLLVSVFSLSSLPAHGHTEGGSGGGNDDGPSDWPGSRDGDWRDDSRHGNGGHGQGGGSGHGHGGGQGGGHGHDDANDASDWPMYHHDVRGTRHNTKETKLSPWSVGRLRTLWNVPTPAPVTGTPVVVDDKVFVGDWAGNFYALKSRNGQEIWKTHVAGPISASPLVRGNLVIFGDQTGWVYALDRRTGAIRWQVRPNSHPLAAIFGSPTPVGRSGRYIALGTSSNEEEAAANPAYPCCSFRGSTVLIDSENGRVVWQTYTISEAEQAEGSSGASVWGTPTYDDDLDLIFVATSNNYSEPATSTSDAFYALDRATGSVVWKNQRIEGDVSNFSMPVRPNKDVGIGDSVAIYRLPNGRKVVGAGSKNGVYWALDASTGVVVGEKQVQNGGSLGGLLGDSAVAYGLVFSPGTNWPDPFDPSVLPIAGLLTAHTTDERHTIWQIQTPQSVNISGVAVANAVVYFSSCNPGVGDRLINSGTLHAVSALTGRSLAVVPLAHCSNSGPSVVDGRVYVGSGNRLLFAGDPPGSIEALGL